jgi:preprotein translocase subunit SecD
MRKNSSQLPFIFILLILSCSTSHKTTTAKLPDGMYLVLAEYQKAPATAEQGVVIPFSHDFLLEASEEDPRFLAVDPADFVELQLASAPEQSEQPNQRVNLLLSLNSMAKDQLAAFTAKNLNKPVAIVIGGQAVTKHNVKSVIDGGKLQISWCTKFACEKLLVELQDNVGQ